jgi:ABC-type uncharacterized transport system substrate-binding protein
VKRREFITLLGGAAVAAWPLAARAQQPAMPVVGFVRSTSLAFSVPMVAAFRQGLTAAGFNEGQNVAIECRFADSQLGRLPGLVAELIRLPVAVIVANVNAALAAKAATSTVPIVFATGSDPVVDGLVASLNRPGGNVTGVSFVSGLLGTKRLDMLRQLVPAAATMAMLVETDTLEARIERRDVELAAQALGQHAPKRDSQVRSPESRTYDTWTVAAAATRRKSTSAQIWPKCVGGGQSQGFIQMGIVENVP